MMPKTSTQGMPRGSSQILQGCGDRLNFPKDPQGIVSIFPGILGRHLIFFHGHPRRHLNVSRDARGTPPHFFPTPPFIPPLFPRPYHPSLYFFPRPRSIC